jgi:hypothetical protein
MLPIEIGIIEMDNHELLAILHDVRQLSLLEAATPLRALRGRERMEPRDSFLVLEKHLEIIVQAADIDAHGNTLAVWKCASRTLLLHIALTSNSKLSL